MTPRVLSLLFGLEGRIAVVQEVVELSNRPVLAYALRQALRVVDAQDTEWRIGAAAEGGACGFGQRWDMGLVPVGGVKGEDEDGLVHWGATMMMMVESWVAHVGLI